MDLKSEDPDHDLVLFNLIQGVTNSKLLLNAIEKNDLQVFSMVLKLVPPSRLDRRDSRGCTLLMHACKLGRGEMVTMLLDRGSMVNAVNMWGATALFFAVLQNDTQLVEQLLASGAEILFEDACCSTQETTLDFKVPSIFSIASDKVFDLLSKKLEEKTAEKSSVAGVFHAQHKKSMREKIRSENPQLLPSWSRSNMSKLQLQQGCARQLASKFYEQRQLCSGQWDGNIGTCLLVNALQRSDLRKEKSFWGKRPPCRWEASDLDNMSRLVANNVSQASKECESELESLWDCFCSSDCMDNRGELAEVVTIMVLVSLQLMEEHVPRVYHLRHNIPFHLQRLSLADKIDFISQSVLSEPRFFFEVIQGVDMVWAQEESKRWRCLVERQRDIVDAITLAFFPHPSSNLKKSDFVEKFLGFFVEQTEMMKGNMLEWSVECGIGRCGSLEIADRFLVEFLESVRREEPWRVGVDFFMQLVPSLYLLSKK